MLSDEEELKRIKMIEERYSGSSDYKSQDIVPFNDADKLKFHKYIKSLAQDLLGDKYDLDKTNLVFLLSDDLTPNAAFMHRTTPDFGQYIYLTAPVFELCQNKDQLAFILGHELGHFEKFQELGTHTNTKAEEEYADLSAISKMVNAGLNIEESYQLSQKLFKSYNPSFRSLINEHMLDGNRVKVLGDMVTAQRKTLPEKGIDSPDIIGSVKHDIDKDIINLVQTRPHNQTIKDYFFSPDFTKLSDDDKMTAYFNKIEESLVIENDEFGNKQYTIKEPNKTILKEVSNIFFKDGDEYKVDGKWCSCNTRRVAATLESVFKEKDYNLMQSKAKIFHDLITYDTVYGIVKDLDLLRPFIAKEFAGFRESVQPETNLFIAKRDCMNLFINYDDCHQWYGHLWFGLDNVKSDVGKKFSKDVLEHTNLSCFTDGRGNEIKKLDNGDTIFQCDRGVHVVNPEGIIELFSSDPYLFRAQFIANQINNTIKTLNDIKEGKEIDPNKKIKTLLAAWQISSPEIASIGKDGHKCFYGKNINAMGLTDVEDLSSRTPLREDVLKQYLTPEALSFYNEREQYPQINETGYTAFIKQELLNELKVIHDSNDQERNFTLIEYFSKVHYDHEIDLDEYKFRDHRERDADLMRTYIDLFGAARVPFYTITNIEDACLKQHFDKYHTLDGYKPLFADVFENAPVGSFLKSNELPYKLFEGKEDAQIDYRDKITGLQYLGSSVSPIYEDFHNAAQERFKQNLLKIAHTGTSLDFYMALTDFDKIQYDISKKKNACLYQYVALDFYEKSTIENKIKFMSKALGKTASTGDNSESLRTFKQKCNTVFKKDFENPDISLPDKIKLFTALANENLFDEKYENYFEILTGKDTKGGLLKQLDEYSENKAPLYLHLITSGHRIVDPEIRADIIQKSAECWIKENGQYNDITATETERDAFIEKINKLKKDYVDNMSFDDANGFLRKIAELTLSQDKLSHTIAPEKITIDTQDKKTIAAAYGLDALNFLMNRNIISSKQVQDLLLGGSSIEEITQKCNGIKASINKRFDETKNINASSFFPEGILHNLNERQAQNYLNNLISPQYLMQIKKEFDAAPLVGKGAVMQMIMYGNNWKDQFKTVADKLFSDAGELGKIGEKFLYNYIDSREDSEKSYYLAAIYVAAQNKTIAGNDPNSPYTPEQRSVAAGMRLFLENSGPAGVKLAQAMASYSEVPDFIRDEMQKAKSQANPPARWEIFDWLEQSGQMDLLKHGKLGKLLGSASFFATFDLIDDSKDGKVVKILRAGSKTLADNEFKIYKDMLDKMSAEFSGISSFKRLVDNAASMVDVETNLNIGEKQLQDAKKLYPESVSTDNTEFKIQVMDWCARGESWASMDKARGKDFKDLKQPYKKTAAKAVFTTELANMLSGQRFDSDRHSGQYKFDDKTNTIGIFDTGSISIIEPTSKEKEVLGKILGQTVLALKDSNNVNVGKILSAEIDKGITQYYAEEIKKGEPVPPYLSEFQRGLLALNDFYSEIPPKELVICFMQALNNGKHKIAPQIYQGFISQMNENNTSSFDKKLDTAKQIIDVLNHKDDIITPEAKAAQKIGRLVTALTIESGSGYKALTMIPDKLKNEKLLELLDTKTGKIHFAKGVMKEIISELNPSNYSPTERREVGAILYKVVEEGSRRKKLHQRTGIAALFEEQLATLPNAGKYAQTIQNIVGLTASMGIETSLKGFKKSVILGRLIDTEVQAGYSEALQQSPHRSIIRKTLEKINPLHFVPHQSVKKIAKVAIKDFAPHCLKAASQIRHLNIAKVSEKQTGKSK